MSAWHVRSFDTFGRYGFEVPAGASEKLGEVTHKLEPAPGGGRRVKRLFFDPVLDITLRWAREALVLKEKALRDAFALHDTNGDGCLDSVEFAKLVAAVAGQSDEFLGNGRAERDILHMYADAIEVRSICCLFDLLAACDSRSGRCLCGRVRGWMMIGWMRTPSWRFVTDTISTSLRISTTNQRDACLRDGLWSKNSFVATLGADLSVSVADEHPKRMGAAREPTCSCMLS